MIEALVFTLDIFVNASVAIDWLAEHDKNTSLKALSRIMAKQRYSQTKFPSKLTMKLATRMGLGRSSLDLWTTEVERDPISPIHPFLIKIDVLELLSSFKVGE